MGSKQGGNARARGKRERKEDGQKTSKNWRACDWRSKPEKSKGRILLILLRDVEYELRHVARNPRDASRMWCAGWSSKKGRGREERRGSGCGIFFPVETNALRVRKFQSPLSLRRYRYGGGLFQLGRTEIHGGKSLPTCLEAISDRGLNYISSNFAAARARYTKKKTKYNVGVT